MEYLAPAYQRETVIRVAQLYVDNAGLQNSTSRRGERAPPGARLSLAYDGGKKQSTGDVNVLPEVKPRSPLKVHVLQAQFKPIRGSPAYEACLAYRQAQMLGEPEMSHSLDIRV
jgi:hypothetical protein